MTHFRPTRPRYTGPGMTAGNMRANGVRNLDLRCGLCHHIALMNADHLPDAFELMSIEPRLVCTRCRSIGQTNARPNWIERKVLPSLTGNQYPNPDRPL
jgi:hypothetical protein